MEEILRSWNQRYCSHFCRAKGMIGRMKKTLTGMENVKSGVDIQVKGENRISSALETSGLKLNNGTHSDAVNTRWVIFPWEELFFFFFSFGCTMRHAGS